MAEPEDLLLATVDEPEHPGKGWLGRQRPAGTYNYGVYNNNTALPTIGYSTLTGSAVSVYLDNATAKVANSQLVRPLVSSGLTYFSNYDTSLAAVTGSP